MGNLPNCASRLARPVEPRLYPRSGNAESARGQRTLANCKEKLRDDDQPRDQDDTAEDLAGVVLGNAIDQVGTKGAEAEDRAAVIGRTMAMTASEGNARHRLAELTARAAPRRVWPMYSPTGSAMASAISSEPAEMPTCSASRTGMPFGPLQWAGSVNQVTVWL